MLYFHKECHKIVQHRLFTNMLFLLQSVLPVRGVYIHVSHKESYHQRFIYERQSRIQNCSLIQTKSVCWDIRHHRVTLQSQTEHLFIHNSFVVSGAHSVVDHILFCLCSEADLLCRDVHIYSIHRLHTAHMLQAQIHY